MTQTVPCSRPKVGRRALLIGDDALSDASSPFARLTDIVVNGRNRSLHFFGGDLAVEERVEPGDLGVARDR